MDDGEAAGQMSIAGHGEAGARDAKDEGEERAKCCACGADADDGRVTEVGDADGIGEWRGGAGKLCGAEHE